MPRIMQLECKGGLTYFKRQKLFDCLDNAENAFDVKPDRKMAKDFNRNFKKRIFK